MSAVSLFSVSKVRIRISADNLSISDERKAQHLAAYLYNHCPSGAWMIICGLVAAAMTDTDRFGTVTADDVDEALRAACKFERRRRKRENRLNRLANARRSLLMARQSVTDKDARLAIDAVAKMVEELVSLETR